MAQVARKTREGTVVSDKMDKTVVVTVSSSTRHRLYKKLMRRLRRYMVHDETNEAKLGDRVRIVESRPYSRRKRWQLAEVLVRPSPTSHSSTRIGSRGWNGSQRAKLSANWLTSSRQMYSEPLYICPQTGVRPRNRHTSSSIPLAHWRVRAFA